MYVRVPSSQRIARERHPRGEYCTIKLPDQEIASAFATVYKFAPMDSDEEDANGDVRVAESNISSGELCDLYDTDYPCWIILPSTARDTSDPVDITNERDNLRMACESGHTFVATLTHTNKTAIVRIENARFPLTRGHMPDPVVGWGVVTPFT